MVLSSILKLSSFILCITTVQTIGLAAYSSSVEVFKHVMLLSSSQAL